MQYIKFQRQEREKRFEDFTAAWWFCWFSTNEYLTMICLNQEEVDIPNLLSSFALVDAIKLI